MTNSQSFDVHVASSSARTGVLFYCMSPTKMHEQIMEMALNMDADVNNVSYVGKSAFMFACEHAEECDHLCMRLLKEGANPDVVDPVRNYARI